MSLFSIEAVEASEVDQDVVGYSVEAVLPDNQRDGGNSYFDLLVEPEETYKLEVVIYNHQDQNLVVDITPTTASTNRNGLIVYEPQEEYDNSLTYPISELISIDEEQVTVPANESKVVATTLQMPEKAFEGSLLGGLEFKKVINDETTNQSVQINNQYAYVIGLQVTEDEAKIAPNLNLLGIEPALVNHHTAVVAQIQNNQPVIISGLSMEAEVYREGENEPIKTASLENALFAPNSTMDFTIDWENAYLEPGNYRLKMYASNKDHEWKWDETFTISEEQSKISDEAVELEKENWLLPAIFIAIIVILLIIIGILLYKYKKK